MQGTERGCMGFMGIWSYRDQSSQNLRMPYTGILAVAHGR